MPSIGLVDGCRCNSVCEYSVYFLKLDTLILVKIGEKKTPEILNTVVLIFMFYYVGVIKVHRIEMHKEVFFKLVQSVPYSSNFLVMKLPTKVSNSQYAFSILSFSEQFSLLRINSIIQPFLCSCVYDEIRQATSP